MGWGFLLIPHSVASEPLHAVLTNVATSCSDLAMEKSSPVFESFSAIIEAFGGPGPFGDAIGIPDSHARTMKARDSIPSTRWTDVVAAADRLQIEGVTLQILADLDAARVKNKKSETEGAGAT